MLKWERKLLELAEKYRLLLAVLFAGVLTLYLRKIGVWWMPPHLVSAFDMHPGYTESSLYHLLVRGVQFLPLLPAHSIKWLAGLSDYVLAALCVCCMGKRIREWKDKEVIFTILLMFSPVLYLRGIIWGQIDSAAVMLLVGAYLLEEGKVGLTQSASGEGRCRLPVRIAGIVLSILACALYPCLLPIVLLYCIQKNILGGLYGAVVIIAGTILVSGVAGGLLGVGFREGMETLLRWATYDAVGGSRFVFGADFLAQLFVLYGLAGSVFLVIKYFEGKVTWIWPAAAQIIVTIVYGSKIFLEKLY